MDSHVFNNWLNNSPTSTGTRGTTFATGYARKGKFDVDYSSTSDKFEE